MKIEKKYKLNKIDSHLHSAAHVLADDLSIKFSDKKHFGFYLKTALTNDHNFLRRIAGQVLEGKAKNPGALFTYLLKKEHEAKNSKSS